MPNQLQVSFDHVSQIVTPPVSVNVDWRSVVIVDFSKQQHGNGLSSSARSSFVDGHRVVDSTATRIQHFPDLIFGSRPTKSRCQEAKNWRHPGMGFVGAAAVEF